jgi:hypothetical protein
MASPNTPSVDVILIAYSDVTLEAVAGMGCVVGAADDTDGDEDFW